MITTQSFQEKQIAIGRNMISYYDNMAGDPVLIFIHGSFLNKDYWQKQLYHFSSHNRVIALDLAGHGKSTTNREDFTIDQYGNDIAAIINQLELNDVILIGHSIGGDIMLAANAESNKNIIGLIGIDYFENVGSSLAANAIDQIMRDLRNNFVNSNVAYAKNTLLTDKTDYTITQRVIQDFKTISPRVGISLNEDFFHFPKKEVALLKKLDKKLYLVNSDYQPTNESSLKKVLNDNYELKIIKGTCHFPMIENPGDLNNAIETFVQDIMGNYTGNNDLNPRVYSQQ
jgi:sigma-B regulation protein RsbQ